MALPRELVTSEYLRELDEFAALVRSLDEREWGTPSRCAGWTVADVAAHVAGTLASVVAGDFDGLGTPEVTRREVETRRGRAPGEVADEIDAAAKVAADMLAGFDDAIWDGPAPPGVPGTLGDGVEALWYDAYLHGDDICAATGRASQRGIGLQAAVSHVATQLGQRGGGDALEFVLAATGRADPVPLGLDESVNIYA